MLLGDFKMTRKGLTRKKKNIILTILCAVLAVSLAVCVGFSIFNTLSLKKENQNLVQTNNEISSKHQQEKEGLESQLNEKDKQIAEKDKQIKEKDNKISSLNSRVTELEKLKADKLYPTKPLLPAVSVDTSAVNSIKEAENLRLAAQNKMANGNKICFLTFDDGPNMYTEKILTTLKQYNVKATFFVTQQNGVSVQYKHLIKRAYDEGHAIGVHTASHEYSQIYKSEAAYLADFNKMNGVIKSLIGKEVDIFRFPGGSSNAVSKSYCRGIMSKLVVTMTKKGYQYFDWNVGSGDANYPTPNSSTIARNVINGCKGRSSACVLMHDKSVTANALPTIIVELKKQGFVFLPLTVDNYGYHHGLNN